MPPTVVFAQAIDKFIEKAANMPPEHWVLLVCSAFVVSIYLAGAIGWFDDGDSNQH